VDKRCSPIDRFADARRIDVDSTLAGAARPAARDRP
jgi:hypothetical protein